MKARFIATALAALMVIGSTVPAHADVVFQGICTMSITVDFVGTVTNTSGPRSFEILEGGGGSCVITGVGVPPSDVLTFGRDNFGSASAASCPSFVGQGNYSIGFQQIRGGSGTFTIRGSINGVVMMMTHPGFTGVAFLETASTACMTSGVGSVSYSGPLYIIDPQ